MILFHIIFLINTQTWKNYGTPCKFYYKNTLCVMLYKFTAPNQFISASKFLNIIN